MSNPVIKVKKTHPDAVLPTANNKETGTGDTGFDLVAVEDVYIPSGSSKVVQVGLSLADITPGYWVKIEPRSGLGFKHSLQPHLGVIDNGYRGDLGVKMYNFHESTDIAIQKGDKVAQLVIYRLIQPSFEFSDEITDTTRGSKGFGSSDKKSHYIKQEEDDWSYSEAYAPEGTIQFPKLDQGDPTYIEEPDTEKE